MEQTFKQEHTTNKTENYHLFLKQLATLIEDETNVTALLANTSAALHEAFGFFWVGFYLVKDKELVLGPFQGSVACFRIPYGRGVCGTAWAEQRTIIVPDVDKFPGHIACSSLSRSEIVIPLLVRNEVQGVLDIDSDQLDAFDNTDRQYLEKITHLLASKLETQ